jgi:hypothetical protein
MNYNKLPADPSALILGIISVVIVFPGFCCGLFPVISIVLGIVGIISANKSLKEYDVEPSTYNHNSRKNVFAGKVLSIIGLSLSTLYVILVLGAILFFAGKPNYFWDKFKNEKMFHQLQDSIQKGNDAKYEDYKTDSLSVEPIDSIGK